MISTANSGASSPERALESGSSRLASGPEPGRMGLPASDALQSVAPAGRAILTKLRRLLRVARNRETQRALRFGVVGVRAKSEQRGRLAAGTRFTEIAGVSALQTLRLDGVFFNFARA